MLALAVALPATRQAEARVDFSIDFFYDNIESDGSWIEVADYGYCWQPRIAVTNFQWRPYWDGYWAYTDVGWTWISYEDFGWATYHYGRWIRIRHRGWFWVPGREWGPAWVSWRTGGDYVGWAPLPPRGGDEIVYEASPIGGHVDVEFDIGPSYYNFIEVRYIGEPVLRERIIESHLNVTYISNTVNVTNITYANSVVYNHGPDYNTLSQYSARPIRRMTLEREANADLTVAARSKGLTKVQGDKLIVAAPATLQKPVAPVAPKTVKEKIVKPTIERGWNDVADPKIQADLKEKMKSEDPRKIPPPSLKPRDKGDVPPSPMDNQSGGPSSGPATPAVAPRPVDSAHPAPLTTPKAPASSAMTPEKARAKEKGPKEVSPIPAAVAPVDPGLSPATTPPGKLGPGRLTKPPPGFTPPASDVPGTAPSPVPKKPGDRHPNLPSTLATSPDGTPFREGPMRDKDVRKDQRIEGVPGMMPPTRQPADGSTERAPRKPKNEPMSMPPVRQTPPDIQPKRPLPPERFAPPPRQAPPEPPRKSPLPPERVAPPPAQPGPAAKAPGRPEAPQKGPNKKGGQPVPTPGPQ